VKKGRGTKDSTCSWGTGGAERKQTERFAVDLLPAAKQKGVKKPQEIGFRKMPKVPNASWDRATGALFARKKGSNIRQQEDGGGDQSRFLTAMQGAPGL